MSNAEQQRSKPGDVTRSDDRSQPLIVKPLVDHLDYLYKQDVTQEDYY